MPACVGEILVLTHTVDHHKGGEVTQYHEVTWCHNEISWVI